MQEYLKNIWSFYRRCVVKAFSGRFWRIEQWTGGLAIVTAVITLFLPLPAGVEEMMESDLPLFFFVCVFALVVLAGLISAPYEIYKEEHEARLAAQSALKPSLKIFRLDNDLDEKNPYVSTEETYGGDRYTSYYGEGWGAVTIYCQNIGEKKTGKCFASIQSARFLGPDGPKPIQIIEPIYLPWSNQEPDDHLSKILRPGETSRVWVGDVRHGGQFWLWKKIDKLNEWEQRVFGGVPGKYEVTIAINDENSVSVAVKVLVETEKIEQTPNSAPPPRAKVSILETGSLALSLRDSEEETLR